MTVRLAIAGHSRSFPDGAPDMTGDGHVFAGDAVGAALAARLPSDGDFIAIELGLECLAEHVGLDEDPAHRRTVGFARFRLGEAAPSRLIELVHQPWTDPAVIAAARAAFESGGFIVAACADMPGRIVNRLIRPYFNAVLRRLDDGLASADDMDTTLCLGLGYPEGPNTLLVRSGLAHHFDVSEALYRATGDPDLAPARRAHIAKKRQKT